MPRQTPLAQAATLRAGTIYDAELMNLEAVMRALANEYRLLIVNALAKEMYMSVSDFSESFGLSQSRTSYHLKRLVDVGLVQGERLGNFVWYRLVDGALEQLGALFATE